MIPPGKSEVVEFSTQTPQKAGSITKQISLTSNDRQSITVTLQGEVSVLAAVRVQPETVNFAQLKRDSPEQKQVVTITRGDGGPLKPRISNVGNPQIKADLREIEAGEKYDLEVTVAPPWPNGMLQGAVVLETGVEEAPLESIRVFANVTPRLQAVPQRYMIQNEPKADLDLSARLNWDGEPAKILAVSTSDPTTSVQVTDENNQQIVVLHVPAGYNPQNKMGNSVTIKTDDPVVPVMQIPIMVMNQNAAAPGQPVTPQGRVVPLRVSAQPSATTKPATPGAAGAQDPPK
jgi:hypothetical protein